MLHLQSAVALRLRDCAIDRQYKQAYLFDERRVVRMIENRSNHQQYHSPIAICADAIVSTYAKQHHSE
jgi:hypothetical protein